VPVYRWALPSDVGPLRNAIASLIARRIDIAVFTTAVQVEHLFQVAAEGQDSTNALATALAEDTVVAVIGPTAAEAVTARGIRPDLVPEHPKLGYLVSALAERGPGLVAKKRAHAIC
jgi:uroporphyrinogen-III synthase